MSIIVSNTGPLISLERLSGGFDLLKKLYSRIIIPPAVLQEISTKYKNPEDFLFTHQINNFLFVESPHTLLTDIPLHSGEVEAISLAYERQLPLLIEEHDGRKAAKEKGLQISGIAGQIFKSHQQKIITAQEGHCAYTSTL